MRFEPLGDAPGASHRMPGEAPSGETSEQATDQARQIGAFLEEVYARYGYDLRDYASVSIRRRVLAVLSRSGLQNVQQLRRRVIADPAFFATIVQHLTVRVSEMFRDPLFYKAFRAQVVPLLRTYPILNVWHCGCASGEEVYSSAILLMEEGLYDRTQIYATDLSSTAVDQARQGIYLSQRLPSFVANYLLAGGTKDLASYYTEAYGRVVMREFLRRKVLFFQHDLVCDQVFSEMHVVFCRNVMIYFNHDLRQRVLRKLGQSLCHGGFLCVGSAERLSRSPHQSSPGLPESPVFSEFAGDERIYRQCL